MSARPPSARRPIALSALPANPLVSVLVSNYNYAQFLPETVDSVIAQTYQNWELIICDDGSTDNSFEILAPYLHRDSRIQLIKRPNGGQAAALNAAYAASRGEILCTLDADDAFKPNKLDRVVRRLAECPDAGLLVHAMLLVDANGTALHRIPILTTVEEGWIADRVLQRGGRWRYMPSSGLVFRRELAEIGFPIPSRSFIGAADGFLFTLFPLFTKTTFIPEELSVYRIHGTNMGGRVCVDATAARNGANLMIQVVEGVNERLAELAMQDTLQVEDNLHIDLELLIAHLLEGEPRALLFRRYSRSVKAIMTDDLFGLWQKIGLPVLFGCAAILPRRWRRSWLNLAISSGRLKRALAWMVSGLRRSMRFSPDAL